jgi:hypothetical protein
METALVSGRVTYIVTTGKRIYVTIPHCTVMEGLLEITTDQRGRISDDPLPGAHLSECHYIQIYEKNLAIVNVLFDP